MSNGTYRYSLDKSSKKFICPSCNRKKLVKYIDVETGTYLPDKFGKCDGSDKCPYNENPYTHGFHKKNTPIMENITPPVTTIKSEIIKIPDSFVKASIGEHTNEKTKNNLYKYLCDHFDETVVNAAFDKYKIGTKSHEFYFDPNNRTGKLDGCTIFWLLDESGAALGGEIVNFDITRGSTTKIQGERCTRPVWMAYQTHYKKNELHKNPEWVQKFKNGSTKCIEINKKPIPFGLHLLDNKPVAIVEACKTAIIGNLLFPEFTWLAVMSEGCLTKDRLEPLKAHRIVLYPDKGMPYQNWKKKAEALSKAGFTISVSRLVEKSSLNDGDDLADLLTRGKNEENYA